MDTHRITYLLQQFLDSRLTAEEQEELDRILTDEEKVRGSLADKQQVREALEALLEREQGLQDYREEDWDPLFRKIQMQARSSRPVRHLVRKSLMAAAALAVLSVAVWLLVGNRPAGKPAIAAAAAQQHAQDLAPGGNKATLTLADNTVIDLDAAKEGVLGQQGDVRLTKRGDGQLSYQAVGGNAAAGRHAAEGRVAGGNTAGIAMTYNLLTTPRGGQYQLVLPDGSKVWLNAASRLKYPTSFEGKERVVELQGEAYFEIAGNPSQPFKVSLMGQQPTNVEVLGTHFNIKAYADEPAVQATLLEGAIKVHQGASAALLRPGQQARWNDNTAIKVVTADPEETIAWKNGLFKFNEATIGEVMRQLSRWYDVDIEYVNGIPNDLFQGEIYRSVNVSKVLKVLEVSGVHFTVEGKKILVRN